MVKTEKPYSVLPFPVTTGLHSITHHDISLLILIVFLICSVTFTLFIQLWTVQTEYKFHRPYIVNTIQLAVSLVPLLYAARKAVLVNSFRPRSTMGIIAVHVGILTLNAIFVTHIPVTRLHTLHALSIPFAWILSRNSCRRHWGISLSCAVYCVGAWLAGTGRPPLAATAIGVVYAALLALYSVLVKRNLEHTDLWCLLTYQTGVSLLAMVPVTLISGELAQPLPYFVTDAGFWFQMIVTGLMGLFINACAMFLIQHTSPMTHLMAVGTKTSMQAIMVALFFGNHMSGKASLGTMMALIGSLSFHFWITRNHAP